MKRIIIVIILAILIGTAGYLHFHQSKPKPVPIHHKPMPVQVIHGVKLPYNDCIPNETGALERKHQQEIIDTAKAIQQEEKVTNGQISTGLTALNQKYSDLIAKYDTCTLVDN